MIRCCITDGEVGAIAASLLAGGADWVQIRQKELAARELMLLVRRVMALPNPHSVKVLVNTRVERDYAFRVFDWGFLSRPAGGCDGGGGGGGLCFFRAGVCSYF